MSVALTGKDITTIGNRIMSDFGNGDVVVIDFPNNIIEGTTGKNGNTIFAFNSTGKKVTLTARILSGSPDDKFLNSEMALFLQDPAGYTLLNGEFIKRVGDGQGNVNEIIYTMEGGAIQKMVGAKDNVEGDLETPISIYTFLFANTSRSIA